MLRDKQIHANTKKLRTIDIHFIYNLTMYFIYNNIIIYIENLYNYDMPETAS